MSQFQKIIKYCAIFFALFLTASIFGVVFVGVLAIGSVFSNNEETNIKDLKVLEISRNDYRELDIEIGSSSILIKEGNSFKVETNNKYVKVKEENDSLNIYEKVHFFNDTENTVVIYIPYNYSFSEVSIESGAGKVDIEKLNTRDISLDLGAGKVDFGSLVVLEETEINGGVGAIEIGDGVINNLDLDMGVGKLTMKAQLTGNNDINAGVGDADITLIGTEDDYMIRGNKGIGEVTISSELIKNNIYYGTGTVNLNINGGIGDIAIEFIQ